MIRDALKSFLGGYLVPIETVVLVGCAWWAYEHIKGIGAAENEAEHVAAAAAELRAHTAELAAAAVERDLARQGLSDYRAAHPVGVVRLLPSAGSVPAAGSSGAGTCAGTGPVQPVPAGDTGGGPRREGVDIGGLLEALAASADTISDDLRQQQRVK